MREKIEEIVPAAVEHQAGNGPNPQGLPTHSQLALPLLETIAANGGSMKPSDAINALAQRLGISASMREASVPSGRGKWEGRRRFVWKNRVAWARMTLVEKGLIDNSEHGCWSDTKKAREMLTRIRHGIVLKVYETPNGTALWATAEAAAGVISDNSLNLIFSSPPYKLEGRPKQYGNLTGAEYIQWMVNLGREWKRVLVDDGSLVLNMGDVWAPGAPEQSSYQERLLIAFLDELKFHLAQKMRWEDPSKLPTSPWVTKQRIRVNCSDELLLWLGKTARPYANAREVLTPHSAEYLARIARRSEMTMGRPSGHRGTDRSRAGGCRFRDNGGSIPHSVLRFAHAGAHDPYLAACEEIGIVPHPARMPWKMAEFVIRLTTRPGDVVYDPFAGSNVVGQVAEELGRRHIASENCLEYACGSALRFAPGQVALREHWDAFDAA